MVEIVPRRHLVAGIKFTFRGVQPDETGKLTGEEISRELIVPPLNFDSLLMLEEQLKSLGSNQGWTGQMGILADCLEHAIGRNYTNVPRWMITQSIDIANFADLLNSVMNQSGLTREDGEKKVTAQSDGSTSLPTS